MQWHVNIIGRVWNTVLRRTGVRGFLTACVMSHTIFSPCRPCPASSAARPCMWRRRWPTSGWVGGSDRSCRCSGAAEAARCSHILNTGARRWGWRGSGESRIICIEMLTVNATRNLGFSSLLFKASSAHTFQQITKVVVHHQRQS